MIKKLPATLRGGFEPSKVLSQLCAGTFYRQKSSRKLANSFLTTKNAPAVLRGFFLQNQIIRCKFTALKK